MMEDLFQDFTVVHPICGRCYQPVQFSSQWIEGKVYHPECVQTLPPRARAVDPPTSKAAAKSMKAHAMSHQEAILGVMWKPMNQFHIAKLTGLSPEQVHKRLSELSRDNPETGYKAQIRDTGMVEPGPSGRDCIVWEKVIG